MKRFFVPGLIVEDLSALTERRLESLKAEIAFPRGSDYDNITHMKVTIKPDSGIYSVRICDVLPGGL